MANKLTKGDIAHLAKLSKLDLSPEEGERLTPQISSILENVAQIKGLDLKGLPETNQVTNKTNEFRSDKVEPSFTQEEALSMAKNTHNGYFVVNQLIDNEAK